RRQFGPQFQAAHAQHLRATVGDSAIGDTNNNAATVRQSSYAHELANRKAAARSNTPTNTMRLLIELRLPSTPKIAETRSATCDRPRSRARRFPSVCGARDLKPARESPA